jgi:hypothetical protein
MSGINVLRHEPVRIRELGLDERWVHEQIKKDPSILGLGDLKLREPERVQVGGGRLDLLLENLEADPHEWYETEVQLGETDPSHIVRCIEYWDHEKRRLPGYGHRPVLIAEKINGRFYRVIQLFGTAIPIVAIQMTALRTDNGILLHFTKMLDERPHSPEEEEDRAPRVDRAFFEGISSHESMQLVDSLFGVLRSFDGHVEPDYSKARIRPVSGGRWLPIGIHPKKKFVVVSLDLADEREAADWRSKLEQAGVDVSSHRPENVRLRLTAEEFEQNAGIVKEILEEASKSKGD